MRPKNKFLLFITACIPGCGQMYQGYMKRGVSILSLFSAIIAVATWLYFGQLALALPVLWLYAFFDTYNLRRALADGSAAPDAYPFGLSEMDQEQMGRLFKTRHSLIGWILILIGAYLLVHEALDYFIQDYYLVNSLLPRLVGYPLMIGLGIWFIRGPKQSKADDSYAYTPPQPNMFDPAGAAPDDAPEYQDVVNSVLRGVKTAECAETNTENNAETADNGEKPAPEEDRHDVP